MNNTISTTNINHSKTSISDGLSKANAVQGGGDGVDVNHSSGAKESFQQSIQKVHDDALHESEVIETESGGNELPPSNNSSDSTADDDRLLSTADFPLDDFSGQLNIHGQIHDQRPTQNKPMMQTGSANIQSISPAIDSSVDENLNKFLLLAGQHVQKEANVSDESNMLPSHARQLLKTDLNVNAKNARQIASNVTTKVDKIEQPIVQQVDISLLNSDQIELPSQKSQILTTLMQQQQMLANNQTSLLSQTVSVNAELDSDGLPLLSSSAVSNFSTTSLSSIPQAEIVETFARPSWSQGMGKQILFMVNQNINSAEIRLNPAHLGPIEVLIDMSEDQVNVSLSSRHAIVREAMEQALPKLREMLDANGFNLADADISQRSFAEQREQKMESDHTDLSRDSDDQSVSAEMNEQTIKQISVSTGMVDYYI